MDFLGDDSDPEIDFTINKDYAKRYDTWRRGEEIQKLKDKYGDADSESSTSEEEDEDGKELTKDVEKQFFKALSCLKERNPKIYDQNVKFFERKDEPKEDVKVKKTNDSSLTLAGYQRKVLLETGGHFSDEENEEKKPFEMMSSKDQEYDIKQSFKDVLKDSDNEDEDNWGNLFTKRIKTAEELQNEEDDYRQWLAGENEKLKNAEVKEELKGLHDYWSDPKLDEGEKFLRDYILNRRYLDNEDKSRIPSYDEIVHDSDSNLSADEDMIQKQDEFEKKYNFRFEEPDREFIKRYPRTLEQSMRKKDDRRKVHREEVKQRKQAERSKKDEELKRLKTLKKKEIMDKIKKLQQITGNDDITFQTDDIDGDFDPEKHDQRMSQIFNDNYYDVGDEEEEKPYFPEYDEELGIDNWENWDGNYEEEEENELHCEDPGFNMDCDYDPNKKKELQEELIENSKRRKKRRKSKFAEALAKEKPVFDPKDKTFEQYVDEFYALDYEDLIGDIPCRFKYRKVVPNDYGLTTEEILNADDRELNRWVSIKKIVQRVPEHVELFDVKAYKRKAENFYKKKKCFNSLYGPKPENEDQNLEDVGKVESKKDRKRNAADLSNIEGVGPIADEEVQPKKKKKNKKEKVCEVEESVTESKADPVTSAEPKKNKKNKKEKEVEPVVECKPDQETSEKSKKKKKWQVEEVTNPVLEDTNHMNGVEVSKKKKKRKKKSKQGNGVVSSPVEQLQSKKRKQQPAEEKSKNHKKRKFNNGGLKEDIDCGISDERLRSYGINPKKYKNKLKYKK